MIVFIIFIIIIKSFCFLKWWYDRGRKEMKCLKLMRVLAWPVWRLLPSSPLSSRRMVSSLPVQLRASATVLIHFISFIFICYWAIMEVVGHVYVYAFIEIWFFFSIVRIRVIVWVLYSSSSWISINRSRSIVPIIDMSFIFQFSLNLVFSCNVSKLLSIILNLIFSLDDSYFAIK